MNLPIYLDYHATTPVDPRVLDAMLPFFTQKFGNAASRNHSFGWVAEEAVKQARTKVAKLIGATAEEIIFTSGATESDNLAIKGAVEGGGGRSAHLITVATEHKAVLDPCEHLRRKGIELTILPVCADGLLDLEKLAGSIRPETILVSVMAANNEIGVLQPIDEIGRMAHERGAILHVDAAQAAGKMPLDVNALNVDLMSLSAHKMCGPKGIGALYVRRDLMSRIVGQQDGGGHERGLRSGTLNVPGIVGFGRACEIAEAEMAEESARVASLRDRLQETILGSLECVYLNGHPTRRLPMNLNISFGYVEGEALLMSLRDVALSTGSACTTSSPQPSHVLRALGLGEAAARSSIRFGLGRFTTAEEVEWVGRNVVEQVRRLRASSPLWEMASAGERFDAWRHPAESSIPPQAAGRL